MIDEEALEAEAMPSVQLLTITKDSGLDPELANEFRINFEEHFKMANEWAKKAKKIVVTDASHTVQMQEARTARLFLRSKRLEIEQFRVSKKEYYLKAGRAIDKVAGFLKNMIEPTESYLDLQEHFVELKKKAEDEAILAREHARLEFERIAEEKRKAEENIKLQAENEKLRKVNEEADRKRRDELAKVQKENEAKLAIERDKALNAEAELRAKKQAEMKAEAEKIKAEENAKSADDNDKLMLLKANLEAIHIPEVKSAQSKRMIEDCKSYIYLAIKSIKITTEEEI